MTTYTATYSPDDNKLRMRSSDPTARLDAATYARVKAAGFGWAPMQKLFVAPMWTPEREDLLLALCGSINDEDTRLVDRATIRAERFDGYSEQRADDATRALDHADGLTNGALSSGSGAVTIARNNAGNAQKQASKAERAMERAVQLWDTSKYWERRAAGALRHAAYKELPAVRHRRIKKIASDKRNRERDAKDARTFLEVWQRTSLTLDRALFISDRQHVSRCFTLAEYPRPADVSQYEGSMSLYSALKYGFLTVEQAAAISIAEHSERLAVALRWSSHYENRLTYETAMLGQTGGIAADQYDIKKGGQVLIDNEWLTVLRVIKQNGKVISVNTNARYVRIRGIEEVTAYREDAATVEQVKQATKPLPLCNYSGEGFWSMTRAEWKQQHPEYKGTRDIGGGVSEPEGGSRSRLKSPLREDIAQCERHRVRVAIRELGGFRTELLQVFVADEKEKQPALTVREALQVCPALPEIDRVGASFAVAPAPMLRVSSPTPRARNAFDAVREQLKQGVTIAVAPELFPTPPDVVALMIKSCEVEPGDCVLEPECGTCAIVDALVQLGANVTAVEINDTLAREAVRKHGTKVDVHCTDFLSFTGDGRRFDRVLMNPPFSQEVAHVTHALTFLKPSGVLSSVMSPGITFKNDAKTKALRAILEARGATIDPLPQGSFKNAGTMANSVLVTVAAS